MQIKPTVVQILGALVDVQTGAIEGSSEAAAAGRNQFTDEGSVGVDASAKIINMGIYKS